MINKSIVRFLFALSCVILIFACQSKKEQEGIISKNKMVKILVDVHLNEAYLGNERQLSRDKIKELTNTYYCDIFEKHEVTEEDFFKSFDYYYTNLDEMQDIYEKVVALLNKDSN